MLTGRVSYCNSVVQALYYSIPFREHVIKYPPHSPLATPNGHTPPVQVPIRVLNNGVNSPTKGKPVTSAVAMKQRAAINAGMVGTPMLRPEDKPDSPEYKKRHAMLAGPILDITYENASSYGMEESTFTALKDIFMAMIQSQSRIGVISPQRFLEIFKRDNEMFRTSMHQDAHEFYGLVLNAVISNVEDNVKRLRELEPPKDDNLFNQAAMSAMTTAANAMGLTSGTRSPGTGWVHDIFEGVLVSETKCLTCETVSQRDETFLDLSIDLEQHSSVTSCLRKFSAEEMLCERNKFHCDNCGGLQEAEKRMKIKKLPKILALHLKRFKYTEDMTRLQKLFHRVVYPYHLRMFNTTDDAEDPDRLYELYAVVVHIGGNAYHGHYVSVIKTQDRGWLLFDDEMVEPVDKHYVRNFFGDKPGMACAYVLFYQETTLEAVQREQEAEGLEEVSHAAAEADIALGHPQPFGTHPASVSKPVSFPSTPIEDPQEEYARLSHAMTSPIPISPTNPGRGPPIPLNSLPTNPVLNLKLGQKTKEERAREKKESKEAEKARKVAEKEKAKLEEAQRKEQLKAEEQQRKEQLKIGEQERKERTSKLAEMHRKQSEDFKAIIAASKQTAAEEEEKRKKEAREPATPIENKKENGGASRNFGSLGRHTRGSRSMSRKSFSWLAGKSGEKHEPMPPLNTANGNEAAPNGVPVPQTPDKHDKHIRERFSFNLGRKKSGLLS